MHDRLFANQSALAAGDLAAHAAAVGLDNKTFEMCVQNSDDSRISSDQVEAARLEVTSTPTFLLGLIEQEGTIRLVKRINGAQPYAVFKQALDETINSLRSAL
jgi:predicted DsbA family dithiol-disulfide isomerase